MRIVHAIRPTAIGLLALAPLATVTPAASAATRCPAGRVSVTIDGTTRCQAPRALRPLTVPGDLGAVLARALGPSGLPRPRLDGGARLRAAYPKATIAAIARAARATQRTADAAASDLLDAGPSAPARAPHPRPRGASFTIGEPVGTVSADGSSATIGITATAEAVDGTRATIEAEIGAQREVGGDATMRIGLGMTVTDTAGLRTGSRLSFGETAGSRQLCPSATGQIVAQGKRRLATSHTLSQRIGPADIGTVRETTSTTTTTKARGALDADARLGRIPFSITVVADSAYSGQALAFFQGRSRAVATATASGTIDPVTGRISADTRFTVSTRGSGGGVQQGRTAMAQLALLRVREAIGDVLRDFRAVEANARTGHCTVIELAPGSVADLDPGASLDLRATLRQRVETRPAVPAPVRWSVVATRGRATPATSTTLSPTFHVTGAASGPITAALAVKAVSRAGISIEPWQARETAFPRTYSGAVTFAGDTLGVSTTWAGTATYTRATVRTNPDGSRLALYDLTSVTIARMSDSLVTCSFDADPYTGTTRIRTSPANRDELEVQVSPGGAWSAAFLIDAGLGPQTYVCPPPLPSGISEPVAFLNSRTVAGATRPMAARGPITATNASDLEGTGVPGVTATASWNLVPSG